MPDTFTGADGQTRCNWCGSVPEFLDYHDFEWGSPSLDDHQVFEKICLESFQSGLSWRTILNKRENFRKAFQNFNIDKIARFNKTKVESLLKDQGIVRHRGKIEALINNAQRAQEVRHEYGSLAIFFSQYKVLPTKQPSGASTSDEAIALAKQLKKLGWKFVGPTTVYAFMQAMGLVNDHHKNCIIRDKVEKSQQDHQRNISRQLNRGVG